METIYYTLNPWWEGEHFETGIDREPWLEKVPSYLQRKQVEVFVGSRRVGKTTILKQFIKALLRKGIPGKDIFYLALDHPALAGISLSDHLKSMRKQFMHGREKMLYLFFDEIQEIPDWEAHLKAFYDNERLKIFCTGSTSALIAKQGGKLTGRQIISVVYPLSFQEFIRFRGPVPKLSEDYKFEKLAEEYLSMGGYPEQVLNPSSEYMSNLLDDILARDLIRLYPIKKAYVLKDLLRLIGSTTGSRTSFNKMAKVLGLSLDTVKEYIGYLEAAFLIMPLEKWATSYSEKVYSQKKFYFWDMGVKTLLTGPGDQGNKAENAVYTELKRNNIACGYYAESELEVDFVTGSIKKPSPIEVKYVTSFDWKDKRFSGIRLFQRRYPSTRKVLVVSKNVETQMTADTLSISVTPLWKFLSNLNSVMRSDT
jgi:predicted AAA+ superfamily ATPase